MKSRLVWKRRKEEGDDVAYWAVNGDMTFVVWFSPTKPGRCEIELTAWTDDGEEPTAEKLRKEKNTLAELETCVDLFQREILHLAWTELNKRAAKVEGWYDNL